MEITVSAALIKQDITIPMGHDLSSGQEERVICPCFGIAGLSVDHYKLQKCLSAGPNSEVWLASDEFSQSVVVKISRLILDEEIYDRINKLDCDNLVPILNYGIIGDYGYEVMPYYKNGSLCGMLDETVIKETVLPSLLNALKQLHEKHLVHNDIKPENLFWDDEKSSVILGDYGCVSISGEIPKGYSLSYAAPELLLGNPARPSSDWVSVGLTLGTLLSGEKIIGEESKAAVLRWWERSYAFSKGSNSIKQLINGMIQKEARRRLGPKAAAAWVNNTKIGAENRVRHRTTETVKKQVLIFENPRFIVDDIDGMLLAMEHYWEHFVFLFEQRKVKEFLRSIKEEYYRYCLSLEKDYRAEQAVFLLSYYFSGGRFFVWRGIRYTELCELEQTWDYQPDSVKEFLINGSVRFILKHEGAREEELRYVEELMNIGKLNPEKACNLLFIALQGEDNFLWNGVTYTAIEELVDDICIDSAGVDETVDGLLNSSRFQAWMTFQGYGDFVETILKRCK